MAAGPGGTETSVYIQVQTPGLLKEVSAELMEVRLEALAALGHEEKPTQRQHSD